METTNSQHELEMTPAYQRAVGKLVDREVIHCASGLITDAARNEQSEYSDELQRISGGYEQQCPECNGTGLETDPDTQVQKDEPCNECDEGEVLVEVFEHWIISPWLAQRLCERGELVAKVWDFWVWGRQCTGQAILLDSVVCDIYNAMGATWHLEKS